MPSEPKLIEDDELAAIVKAYGEDRGFDGLDEALIRRLLSHISALSAERPAPTDGEWMKKLAMELTCYFINNRMGMIDSGHIESILSRHAPSKQDVERLAKRIASRLAMKTIEGLANSMAYMVNSFREALRGYDNSEKVLRTSREIMERHEWNDQQRLHKHLVKIFSKVIQSELQSALAPQKGDMP